VVFEPCSADTGDIFRLERLRQVDARHRRAAGLAGWFDTDYGAASVWTATLAERAQLERAVA
jgi:hypothetical protein